ncbi:MAG: ROK family protein [Lapillicoccus sp.]
MSDGPVVVVVVSAADPVDRQTGRLVQLPDAPFLVGDVDSVAVLKPPADGEIVVDNDVNWAARAERRLGSAVGVDDFVYLHLGEGLGCAVVTDGEVRRGHSGGAGEIAHVVVPGLGAKAVAFTEVFAQLGLRRPGSTAVDVDAVNHALQRDGKAGDRMRGAIAEAVCAVLQAAVGFADPQLLVMGGPWGTQPELLQSLRHQVEGWPRPLQLAEAGVHHEPDLYGARFHAVELLRDNIVNGSRATR